MYSCHCIHYLDIHQEEKRRRLDLSADPANLANRRLRIDEIARHRPHRVELALLPVWVLPRLIPAVEVERDAAYSREARFLVGTRPGLVDLEVPRGARVRKRRGSAEGGGHVAVKDLVAVEELGQLGGGGGAGGGLVEGWVGEGEVDVAVGILVGWVGEDVGGVVVELLDVPVLELL